MALYEKFVTEDQDFALISSQSEVGLIAGINELKKNSASPFYHPWKYKGGVKVFAFENGPHFHQTLVREKKESCK